MHSGRRETTTKMKRGSLEGRGEEEVTRQNGPVGPEAAPTKQAAGIGGALAVAQSGLRAEIDIGSPEVVMEAANLAALGGAHGRQGNDQHQHDQQEQRQQQLPHAHAALEVAELEPQRGVGLHVHGLHACGGGEKGPTQGND